MISVCGYYTMSLQIRVKVFLLRFACGIEVVGEYPQVVQPYRNADTFKTSPFVVSNGTTDCSHLLPLIARSKVVTGTGESMKEPLASRTDITPCFFNYQF